MRTVGSADTLLTPHADLKSAHLTVECTEHLTDFVCRQDLVRGNGMKEGRNHGDHGAWDLSRTLPSP